MLRSLLGFGVFHRRALVIPSKALDVRSIIMAPNMLKPRGILQTPKAIGRTDHPLRGALANLKLVVCLRHWHSSYLFPSRPILRSNCGAIVAQRSHFREA